MMDGDDPKGPGDQRFLPLDPGVSDETVSQLEQNFLSITISSNRDEDSKPLQQDSIPKSSVNLNQINNFHFYSQGNPIQGAGTNSAINSKSQEKKEDYIVLPGCIALYPQNNLNKHENIFEGRKFSGGNVVPPVEIAIKRLHFDKTTENEAKILSDLHHENVVKFFAADSYSEPGQHKFIYLSMELCHAKNLYDYIKDHEQNDQFDSVRAIGRGKQILAGLDYVHRKKIAHKDMKPQNVLLSLDLETLKIADFGLSQKLDHGHTTSRQSRLPGGTDAYRAPETYKDNTLSRKADVFSLGLTLFYVWSNGLHPFGDDQDLWKSNIKKNEGRDLSEIKIASRGKAKAKDLLEKMLQPNPDIRSSSEDILDMWNFRRSGTTNPHIVMFEEKAEFMFSFNLDGRAEKLNPELETAMSREGFYSAVALDEAIFVLMEDKSVFRCFPFGDHPVWRKMVSMTYGHGPHPPATVVKDCIYVCGGGWGNKDGQNYTPESASVEKFDNERRKWSSLPNMTLRRRHNAVVSLNNSLYVIGGLNHDNEELESVEKLDLESGYWVEVKPLIHARFDAASVEFQGKIYMFGGSNRIGLLRSTECYDPILKTWEELREMKTCKSSFRACAIGGSIYLVGEQKERTIEEYIPDQAESNLIQIPADIDVEHINPLATVVFLN